MLTYLKKLQYEKIRYIFIITMLIMLCMRRIGGYFFLPSIIDSVLFAGLAAFGMAVIFFGILSEQIKFEFKRDFGLFLFLIFLVVSCAVNFQYGFFSNLKMIVWTMISVFVLYCQSKDSIENDKLKLIFTIQNILIVTWLILSFYSLLTFIFQINYYYEISPTVIFRMGYVEQRLFGVFSNPNCASVVSLLTIIFSIMQLNFNSHRALSKKINILNIVIQLFYIVLSSSRGAWCAVLAVAFLFIIVFMYTSEQFKKLNKFYGICLLLFVPIGACLGLYYLMEYMQILFSYIPPLVGSIFSSDHVIQPQIIIKRTDFVDNQDVSNLRFSIWKSAYEIFKTKWLFGTSPGNVLTYAKSVLPETFIAKRQYTRTHNTYIGILLYMGVTGAIFIFTFFMKSLFNTAERYAKNNFKIRNSLFNSVILSIVCVAVYSFVESEILFVNTIPSMVFWLFLGFALDYMKDKRELGAINAN